MIFSWNKSSRAKRDNMSLLYELSYLQTLILLSFFVTIVSVLFLTNILLADTFYALIL